MDGRVSCGDLISVKAVTTTQGFMLLPCSNHANVWLGRPDIGQSTVLVLDRY